MPNKIKIAVIGCGKWGTNHVKTANTFFGKNLIKVCDYDPAAESKVKAISRDIEFVSDLSEVIEDESINAVIIATPAETHFDVAKRCLLKDKHVLVEKPITLHSSHAEELIKIAKKRNLRLMVGHILLFHPAIIKIKEMIDKGDIGELQYIYSNRLNLGTIRTEENILWSFAPHDISVIQYFTGKNPIEIKAHGGNYVQTEIEDTTLTFLTYPGNIHAHIFVSWLHPFKEQRLVVVGNKGMVVFEDSIPKDKLKFYKKGFTKLNGKIEKFEKDFEVINFDNAQPLLEEQKHFAESIKYNKEPLTNGKHALEVLKILEAAERELKKVN